MGRSRSPARLIVGYFLSSGDTERDASGQGNNVVKNVEPLPSLCGKATPISRHLDFLPSRSRDAVGDEAWRFAGGFCFGFVRCLTWSVSFFLFSAPLIGALRHDNRSGPDGSTGARSSERPRLPSGKRPWQLYRPGDGFIVPVIRPRAGMNRRERLNGGMPYLATDHRGIATIMAAELRGRTSGNGGGGMFRNGVRVGICVDRGQRLDAIQVQLHITISVAERWKPRFKT